MRSLGIGGEASQLVDAEGDVRTCVHGEEVQFTNKGSIVPRCIERCSLRIGTKGTSGGNELRSRIAG